MRRSYLVVLLLLGCAAVPDPPVPGTSQAWGHLRLVPREGVTPGKAAGGSYGDRRLRDVEFVDYTQPGFAVVFVEDEQPPGGELELAIRSSRVATRIEPAHGAVGVGGRVVLRNGSAEVHALSYPAAGVIRNLQPGEEVAFVVPQAGEQAIFLLDVPDASATIFAAPGRFAVVSDSGRFTLTDLAPGSRALRAWHPRFPPATQTVELAPDTRVRVDFELGVGRQEHVHAH